MISNVPSSEPNRRSAASSPLLDAFIAPLMSLVPALDRPSVPAQGWFWTGGAVARKPLSSEVEPGLIPSSSTS